jgi:pilus assembly protein Flp/PilA
MQRVTNFLNGWSQQISMAWRSVRKLTIVAQSGQGLAEYALILALIAIVAILALIFLGGHVSKILSNVGHSV